MIAVTITLPSRLDRAIAMAESFARTNPTKQLVIVVLGDRLPTLDLPPNAEAKTISMLGARHDELEQIQLDGPALRQALIPPIVATLFKRDQRVLLLADSLLVSGDLDPFDLALDEAAVAVAPHPNARDRSDTATNAAIERGVVHPGVIAFRDCEGGLDVLAGWPSASLAPVERRPSPRDAVQAWYDALPQLPQVTTLTPGILQTDTGLFAATSCSWTDTGLAVDGHATPLIDLSQFDPARPHLVSPTTRHARLSQLPVVADLLERHAACQQAASKLRGEDPWTKLADETPLTPLLRQLATAAISDGAIEHSIFSTEGLDEFYRWLAEPATMGASAGLNRYHEALWRERMELTAAYPHLDGPDGFEYAGWLTQLRPSAIPMPDRLAPPVHAQYSLQVDRFTNRPPWGVNVTGLLSGKLGLGESARWVVDTLTEIGVPTKPVQGRLRVPGGEIDEFEYFDVTEAPFAINLACLSGDTLPKLAKDIGEDFFKRRYTAALWWWELPELPESWLPGFDLTDEIWVASDFIYDIIAPVSPVPVYKIKLPVRVAPFGKRSRAQLGMPDDFTFLFVHDYHSTAARKNPVGLIKAFRAAFPEGSGASLVIKSINGDRVPQAHESALVAAHGRSDIIFIDGFLDSQSKNAMLDSCDCYVSLHRSEGFGQTIAEAMWLGKPTIATGFGGNLDFMTTENSYLVDFGTTTVGEDAYPYPADGVWAEPDLDHAALLMQHVFENRGEATERGMRAAADIRRENGVESAGRTMSRRLETIYEWIADDPEFVLNPERISARLPRSRAVAGPAKVTPRQLLKNALERLDHLTLRRQRALDAAVSGVERQLAASNSEVAAQLQRLSREIADLRAELDSLQNPAGDRADGPDEANEFAERYQR